MDKPFDDRVVVVTMLLCAIVGIVLVLMRVIGNFAVPAQLMMLFLAAAVCGLTYRFLGGIEDAKLQTPLITIGGTAALYLALLMWVGPAIEDQFLKSEANPLKQENIKLAAELRQQKSEYLGLEKKLNSKVELNPDSVMSFIKKQASSEEFIGEIIDMVKLGRPPFAIALTEETVRISAIRFEGSDPNRYNACQNTYDLLFPNGSDEGSKLQLSRTINDAGEQRTVTVVYKGPIQRDVCDAETRKIDMQISCADAAVLFQMPEISDCAGTNDLVGKKISATSLRD